MKTPLLLLVSALAAVSVGAVATAEIAADPPVADISTEEALATVAAIAPETLAPDPGVRVVQTATGFAVAGAEARTTIDDDPNGGFAIATSAGRLDVEPVDVDFDADEAELLPGSDTLIAADTAPEADTLTRPVPGGVETFTLIRGPSAPTSYTWVLSLPDGVVLRRAPGGGAYILRDSGAVVARVAAPWARDATGQSVPTRLVIDGDRLTLEVDHRAPGVAYPVLADPSVRSLLRAAKKAITASVALGRKAGPVIVKAARHPVARCLVGAVNQTANGNGRHPLVDALNGCVVVLSTTR